MPRRIAPGGYIYHVFNRAIEGLNLFERPADYLAFERLLAEASEHVPMRIVSYSLMPNHWHLVLWPYEDGDLSKFMHWLGTMHARRWRRHRNRRGRGHIYQGPFRSFPVEREGYGLTLCRYVERNALTANLVRRAEDWRWCSLRRRLHSDLAVGVPPLTEWPGGLPDNWVAIVNAVQTQKEMSALAVVPRQGKTLRFARMGGESRKGTRPRVVTPKRRAASKEELTLGQLFTKEELTLGQLLTR